MRVHGVVVVKRLLTKCQVRVMARTSVFSAMAGGRGANGAANCTIRLAAEFSMACSDGLLISIRSSSPLFFMYTVIWSLPYTLRSEEHTSELQSLMRISYAVFCLKIKTKNHKSHIHKP